MISSAFSTNTIGSSSLRDASATSSLLIDSSSWLFTYSTTSSVDSIYTAYTSSFSYVASVTSGTSATYSGSAKEAYSIGFSSFSIGTCFYDSSSSEESANNLFFATAAILIGFSSSSSSSSYVNSATFCFGLLSTFCTTTYSSSSSSSSSHLALTFFSGITATGCFFYESSSSSSSSLKIPTFLMTLLTETWPEGLNWNFLTGTVTGVSSSSGLEKGSTGLGCCRIGACEPIRD
jgi:hypothetical protein